MISILIIVKLVIILVKDYSDKNLTFVPMNLFHILVKGCSPLYTGLYGGSVLQPYLIM